MSEKKDPIPQYASSHKRSARQKVETPSTKKCPMCAEMIPMAASTCPYCKTRFTIEAKGYCLTCHAIKETDGDGNCLICGGKTVDWQVKSICIDDSATITTTGQPGAGISVGKQTIDEVQKLTDQGMIIEAVKYYRQQTGANLREASRYVNTFKSKTPVNRTGAWIGLGFLVGFLILMVILLNYRSALGIPGKYTVCIVYGCLGFGLLFQAIFSKIKALLIPSIIMFILCLIFFLAYK